MLCRGGGGAVYYLVQGRYISKYILGFQIVVYCGYDSYQFQHVSSYSCEAELWARLLDMSKNTRSSVALTRSTTESNAVSWSQDQRVAVTSTQAIYIMVGLLG